MNKNQDVKNRVLPQVKASGLKSPVKSLKKRFTPSKRTGEDIAPLLGALGVIVVGSVAIAAGAAPAIPIGIMLLAGGAGSGFFYTPTGKRCRVQLKNLGNSVLEKLEKGKGGYHLFKTNFTKDDVTFEPLSMEAAEQIIRSGHLLSSCKKAGVEVVLMKEEPQEISEQLLLSSKEELQKIRQKNSILRAHFFASAQATPEVNEDIVPNSGAVTSHRSG